VGDTFVLCSDGLWDVVARHEIALVAGAIGSQDVPTPADAADALLDLALQRKTPDNVTVLVVRVTTDRPIPAAGARRSLFRRGRR
jgi:serine/threonine protein phosphatase PrpC